MKKFKPYESKLDDLILPVEGTMRLDIVALKYYNNPKYWKVIAYASNIKHESLYITPEHAEYLVIPSDPELIYDNLI